MRKLLLVGMLLALILAACGSAHSTSSEKDDAEIWKIAQDVVKDRLTSPSSAEFPGLDEVEFREQDDGTIVVDSYVDSQNGFGAMMRTDFKVFFSNGNFSDYFVTTDE